MNGLLLFALEGLVVGFALHVRPGPALTVTIRSAARGDALGGPVSFAGRVLADFLPLAGLGALALLADRPGLGDGAGGVLLGLIGGGVLGGMGWVLMNGSVSGALHRDRGGRLVRTFSRNPVWDRLIASVLSPAWHLFWWTAGLWMVFDAAERGLPGIGALAAGLSFAGLAWHSFVAIRLGGNRREWALSDRQYRVLTSLAGLLLVGAAVRILTDAVAGIGIRGSLRRMADSVFS